ncbi:MAG: hypothetical protein SGCHY_004189, partial [Lobulomycetales sp.]
DKTRNLWNGYKVLLWISGTVFSVANMVMAGFGKFTSIMSFTTPPASSLVYNLRIVFLSLTAMFLTVVGAVGLYCYHKMVGTVLSSSSKLVRMREGHDKKLVLQLQRKIYALIMVSTVLSVLSPVDAVLNHLTFTGSIGVTIALILGNLLDLTRSWIKIVGEPESITELSSVPWVSEQDGGEALGSGNARDISRSVK